MNRLLLAILGVFVVLPVYGDQDYYLAIPWVAGWEFLQSVGGIRLGEPKKNEQGGWVLPVVCDASGLTTVTHKPTKLNSSLVVTRMHYHLSGNEIRISVILYAPSSTARTSRCTDIALSGINAGEYQVIYEESNRSAHALGTITIR